MKIKNIDDGRVIDVHGITGQQLIAGPDAEWVEYVEEPETPTQKPTRKAKEAEK